MVKDGWHTYRGRELYVEDDIVLRAVKADPCSYSDGLVPASIYRWSDEFRCWVNYGGKVTYRTAKDGIRSGRYEVM